GVAVDAAAVDERAVRAAEILDDERIAVAEQSRVTARHGGVVDDDGVVAQPADGRRLSDGACPQHAIVTLQRELRHRGYLRRPLSIHPTGGATSSASLRP